AGEPVWLSHLWGANVNPESEKTSRLFRKLVELTRQNLAEGRSALKEEKFRALLWNPPLLHVSDLFNWAETAYGVSLIMDSMSYNRREPYIDTSSEESMLRGLGQNIMEGPMARHTRGPSANYIEDIFHMIKQFDIDMLWVAGHVGCKNTAALNGMLREKCREAGVPMLIINYDLSDPRVASRDAILEQINHFMENIMKARRQDL
ncbi:MAG: 2-hydroxyacyl-CoA dehydratase family protein, partial [Desulfosudaceae bacterium]